MYGEHVQQWVTADGLLYDILLMEWLHGREFTPRWHLHIDALADDMTGRKMTEFSIEQLQRLYQQFGVREYCMRHGESDIIISYHPEELFLFALTRTATGMMTEKIIDMFFGGDYSPLASRITFACK